MTDKEIQENIKIIHQIKKEYTVNKEKAIEFLIKTGICTSTGKLTKQYK